MNRSQRKRTCALLLVLCMWVSAILACQGDVKNMTVAGVPKYVCPSSTPRPTDIAQPADSPTYPAAFQATLDYTFVHTRRSQITIQYLAQNVGAVSVSYTLVYAGGYLYSSPSYTIAYTGNSSGVQSGYSIYISPYGLSYGQIRISSGLTSYSWTISGYSFPYYTSPAPPPCCLPAPIYPTPTLFEMRAPSAFYLDDPIYNRQPPVELRLRMRSPVREGLLAFFIPLISAAAWSIEITNVGRVEYDFLGTGYTYISEVRAENGTVLAGVWPPSHQAATFLTITEQAYGPQAIQPGQTITVQVAAWIPAGMHVAKVALLLNPYKSGDPGWATFAPGSGKEGMVIQWTNQQNTICRGEIAYP